MLNNIQELESLEPDHIDAKNVQIFRSKFYLFLLSRSMKSIGINSFGELFLYKKNIKKNDGSITTVKMSNILTLSDRKRRRIGNIKNWICFFYLATSYVFGLLFIMTQYHYIIIRWYTYLISSNTSNNKFLAGVIYKKIDSAKDKSKYVKFIHKRLNKIRKRNEKIKEFSLIIENLGTPLISADIEIRNKLLIFLKALESDFFIESHHDFYTFLSSGIKREDIKWLKSLKSFAFLLYLLESNNLIQLPSNNKWKFVEEIFLITDKNGFTPVKSRSLSTTYSKMRVNNIKKGDDLITYVDKLDDLEVRRLFKLFKRFFMN